MKNEAMQPTTAPEARSGMAESDHPTPPTRAEVLLAARRRCDDMQDGTAAREQMKREVLATPAELLGDLLAALTEARAMRADFHHPISTPV
ncbi:hypothetical protein [Paracidovorax valerianellae]|uniref:hypothetical protein n=1 Tax=Paracidovorax valerianellae TaxID=187868 RepID=UPI0023021DE3|nr:hypothetical protein [Paracidovorax valerianellae]MDA8444789.1 hypothetical protein [Paracidovorax valerianellae]UYL85444.1 hypothetical protein gp42 [Acidovorax phage Alfacinha3]UYL85545.1 hypothetical protein gp42 [Acidovorax phage Alfacinha1]